MEDDTRLGELLAKRLRGEGHETDTCDNGIDGLTRASMGPYEMAIVDVMLPGIDGMTMTSRLRQEGSRLPVLMLTARDTVEDRVAAIGRRATTTSIGQVLTHGAVSLDRHARRVSVSGSDVELTAKEFDLLECLMEHTGRVLSRAALKEQVWDFPFDAQTKVVDLYVHYLRKKLGDAGDIIQTVRGVGYSVGR